MLAPHMNLPQGSPQKMSRALSRYRDYLKSFYSIKSTACDDKLSIAPCSQFIKLAIIKKEAVSDAFSRSTFHSGVDEIVASKTSLGNGCFIDTRFPVCSCGGPPRCWEEHLMLGVVQEVGYLDVIATL